MALASMKLKDLTFGKLAQVCSAQMPGCFGGMAHHA